MNLIKANHSRLTEARKDSLLVEDIRKDLKTMEQEKEQLRKRIEKTERKLKNVDNIKKYFDLAETYRHENERTEKIALERQEQHNWVGVLGISCYYKKPHKNHAECFIAVFISKV